MELGFVVAERVLYVPSAGFCLLVAMLVQHMIGGDKPDNIVSEAVTADADASVKAGKAPGKRGDADKAATAPTSSSSIGTVGRIAIVVSIVVIGLYAARFDIDASILGGIQIFIEGRGRETRTGKMRTRLRSLALRCGFSRTP